MKGTETEEAYFFLTVRLNLSEPITKKASGGYEYLADTAVGINERDRISENMLCSLATGAKDMSYAKASRHITGGKISRQTVMNCVKSRKFALIHTAVIML